MGIKQFERIKPYCKQKQERKNVQGNKMTKMEKQPNKRNKQKKTYKEITMKKQANTGKIIKTTKEKTGKVNYEDDDSREEANRVLAGNQRER